MTLACQLQLRVVSLNVRVDLQAYRNDVNALKDNEKPWRVRLPLIMRQLESQIKSLDAIAGASKASDATPPNILLCFQEALHHQVVDIVNALNHAPGTLFWAYIGFGRDDGMTEGEYCPIVYQTNRFSVVYSQHNWLSETPDKPSKGWDADCVRILTSAVLEDQVSKQQFAIFNTHLDHRGSIARQESIILILRIIETICKRSREIRAEDIPFILVGDFNSSTTEEAYQTLLASQKTIDAYDAVPATHRIGPEATFTGFRPEEPDDLLSGKRKSTSGDYVDGAEKGRIDYVWFGPRPLRSKEDIMLQNSTGWCMRSYAALRNVPDNSKIFASDHRAIVVDATLSRM